MGFYIKNYHLVHRGNTKDYNVVYVASDEGKYIIIKRWGKVGSVGQVNTLNFTNEAEAKGALREILNTRNKNGYDVKTEKEEDLSKNSDVRVFLGKYYNPKFDAKEKIDWFVGTTSDPVTETRNQPVKKNFTAEVNSNWGAW